MAGATAGRRGGSSLRPGEDLAKAGGSHTRGVRGCVCVLRSTGMRGRAADVRAGAQHATAGRWEPVGAVGVAKTGGAPRGQPREQECEHDGDRALAHPGRKACPVASPRLTAGGAPASAAGTARNGEKEGGFTPCVRGRACAWVHGYANGMCGARVHTLAPRPSPKVRTAAAMRRPVHEWRKGMDG
jgi:hypothetical protein